MLEGFAISLFKRCLLSIGSTVTKNVGGIIYKGTSGTIDLLEASHQALKNICTRSEREP